MKTHLRDAVLTISVVAVPLGMHFLKRASIVDGDDVTMVAAVVSGMIGAYFGARAAILFGETKD